AARGGRAPPRAPPLPEGATRDRGSACAIGGAVPVQDEVHETPVVILHRQDEVEQPLAPAQRPGQTCPVPEVAVELERTGRVVDAGDALGPGLTRRHRLI